MRCVLIFWSFAGVLLWLSACTEQDEPQPPQVVTPEQETSPWRDRDGDAAIALTPPDHEALDQAIDKARATAAQARSRWNDTPESQRHRWAIKWAVSSDEGNRQYVWVQPLHWSPFRVEGRLISQPHGVLGETLTEDDLVSFPIEELADWVYTDGETRDGGFTIDVLEERFGSP